MMKIIILNFRTKDVLVYDYDITMWDDDEEFIESEEVGLKVSDCQWMIVDELNIQIK